jgi:hypothetical protein
MPTPAAAPTAHLVFKTHLDVGFTDLARRVIARYLGSYIPGAIGLARAMRERGGEERFVWTTGSWLIYEYLEQATPAARRAAEQAIAAGDLVWHALPVTLHTELLDASLCRYGLSLAQELDRRFGRQTIAAKMTDVPGHTRALVPLLAEAGVQFLHVGVNPASMPPAVPSLFRWRHDDGSEVIVMYGLGYGAASTAPGLAETLHFAHTGDNCGPQRPDDIVATFAQLRQQCPGQTVRASTMDAFARALLPHRAALPVVTSEIGDTWIHGGATDPLKVARFRALCRWRATQPDSPALRRCSRHLLMVAEHTWGLDAKTHLGDYQHYARPDFEAARARNRVPLAVPPAFAYAAVFKQHGRPQSFGKLERSWAEQRAYLTQAVRELPPSSAAAARRALREVQPRELDLTGWTPLRQRDASLDFARFRLRLDPATGAVIALRHHASGVDLADAAHPLGWCRYQTFSQGDFDRFLRAYNPNLDQPWCRAWAIPDFSKPGMAATRCPSRFWQPRLHRLYRRADHLLLLLAPPPAATRRYGCPARFTLELHLPPDADRVAWTLQWFGKPANRLPEAAWCSFVPRLPAGATWRFDKLGQPIDPLAVAPGGNQHLHGVGAGLTATGPGLRLHLATPDAPLVAPGQPALLHFDHTPPDLAGGVHVNLHNNLWGTNFPLWYEDDARFRFTLTLGG